MDDIEEKAPKENNIQADLRKIQNNSPQQQFENTISINSDLHRPVTTESGRVPSPMGLPSTIVTDQNKIKPNLPDYVVFPSEIKQGHREWTWSCTGEFCVLGTLKLRVKS